jgi:hypothetical protein
LNQFSDHKTNPSSPICCMTLRRIRSVQFLLFQKASQRGLLIMPRNDGRFIATSRLIGALALGALTVGSSSARAQDAKHFVLHVVNDGDDMNLTLRDENASAAILQGTRINHQERMDVLVTKDGSGNGSVSWTTRTASGDKPKCGSGRKSSFSVGAELNVSANNSC